MPDVLRTFIAIDLSANIQTKLEQVVRQLQELQRSLPLRWVTVDNIHLTLKFLGDVPVANLDPLKQIIKNEAGKVPGFEIIVQGLGAFPSVKKPRVVVVKVKAPGELQVLQSGIEVEAARLGIPREERPFSPHLTIGRVSRSASNSDVQQIGQVVELADVGMIGTMRVQAVHLIRSDLRPNGPVYTHLFSAGLKSTQPE